MDPRPNRGVTAQSRTNGRVRRASRKASRSRTWRLRSERASLPTDRVTAGSQAAAVCQAAAGTPTVPAAILSGLRCGSGSSTDAPTSRTFRQQHPDRLHVAIREPGIPTPVPTPPPAARSYRSSDFDPPAQPPVRTVDQHPQPPAPDGQPVHAPVLHPLRQAEPAQPPNAAKPDDVDVNDATPNTPPFPSIAAATCTSACVSTPPVTRRVVSTMVIAIPSASTVQGVARTSREGDRDERAGLNSELGHPPERGVPNSNASTANVTTTTTTMVDPNHILTGSYVCAFRVRGC